MKCKRPFSKGGRLTKNVYNFMSRRARAGSSSSLSLYQEQLKALAHLETDILQLNEMTIKSVISSILASNMIIDNAKIYSIFKLLHVAVQIRPNIIEYIADIFLQFHQRHIDIETFLKMILHFPSFKFFLYQLYKRGVITIEYIIQNLDNDSDLFLYFAPEIEENDPLFFSQHMYLITKSNVCIYNPETHFSRRELGINDSDIAISLRNDDVETLKSILYQANITFVEPSFFERCGYINHVVTLIDYSAYFSAINCFNFLRSQNFEITNSTLNFAIAGGNNDIINICKESLQSVNASTFITAIQFHRNLFLKQIIDFSHIQTDINFLTCSINSNNTTAFLNFLKTDINKLNDEGMTALHCSVHSRNLLYIQALCSTPNIKINQKDINGMTPLHLSASLGYFEIVFYFTFQNRIHINETDNNGYTALHMASKGGFTQIVSLLTSTENIEIDKRNINLF